jgi:hypothetical protein
LAIFREQTATGSLGKRFHQDDAGKNGVPWEMAREQGQLRIDIELSHDKLAGFAACNAAHPHKRIAMGQQCQHTLTVTGKSDLESHYSHTSVKGDTAKEALCPPKPSELESATFWGRFTKAPDGTNTGHSGSASE